MEIHYFWLSQVLQQWKYTISGCRRSCNGGNTLFLAAADFGGVEIHYFWPPQVLGAWKYIISGCRNVCKEIHYFDSSHIRINRMKQVKTIDGTQRARLTLGLQANLQPTLHMSDPSNKFKTAS